jgi:methionyl-tRNA formyltransferase
VAVFTQPDRPAGRGQAVSANAIKAWAQARGLPVHQPEKLTPDDRQKLADLAADVSLVMAYGQILREDFINTPRLGTLNLHTSLLPKFRGASPIQTAIASGERETGVSLMRIVRQLDAGPVADVERVAISPLDAAADLEARLAGACVPLLARTLPKLSAGTVEFAAQDANAANYCRRLEKADGSLDFAHPASVLAARINGLFPWPGCSVHLRETEVKLGLADGMDGVGAPGEIVGQDAHGLLVGTGRGVLRLRRLQRPGAKMLPAADFLRGFPVPVGAQIPSRPMAALVSPVPFSR